MNTLWTKGMKRGSQEAKDVEGAFKASVFLRNRLAEILKMMLEEEVNAKLSDNAYDNPSWAYKQADAVGYARAVKRLLATLDDK